ncbi:MAG: amidohydrolase [Clostridia bacterium]|nr:amidohydrolase [Clostridia bacterium]
MSLLFKNCKLLVRKDSDYIELNNAYLGVSGSVIDYIGEKAPDKKYDEVKDMSGKLLMPGLVNSHGHAPMTLVRGVGSGLPTGEWLNSVIFPLEAKMTPKDIYYGNLFAIMEMLSCGTTMAMEMYDFPFASALAYAEAGMKSNVGRVGLCFDNDLDPDDWPRTKEVIELAKSFRDGTQCEESIRELSAIDPNLAKGDMLPDIIANAISDGKLKASLILHSEYLTTEKYVKRMVEMNKEFNLPINVHISETKSEHDECIERHGKTPMAYFRDLGVLDYTVAAAHCVHLSDEDFEIVKEKDVNIIHSPSSNLKLGSGIARIAKAYDMGINVALGTDGCASNNNLNMFEELHLAALLEKGAEHDPTLIKDAFALDMATVNGVKAFDRDDTGVLEVGKKADVIAVDFTGLHMLPNWDTKALLCYSAQGSDVTMTMVDGKILYENGEFKTIDKEKVTREFLACVEHLR